MSAVFAMDDGNVGSLGILRGFKGFGLGVDILGILHAADLVVVVIAAGGGGGFHIFRCC
jgi:hypothetical protein